MQAARAGRAAGDALPPMGPRTRFLAALPQGGEGIAVLDRTKEAGERQASRSTSTSSPPSPRRVAARRVAGDAQLIGGRYGLSSKDFDPAMAKAVFDELKKATAEARIHGGHHRRCVAYEPAGGCSRSTSSRPTSCARCSSASAPTERWAPTRTRRRFSPPTRPVCAGLLRLRLKEVGVVHDLASALRAEADPRARIC